MKVNDLLRKHLHEECEDIYVTRLDAVMDVAEALQRSQDLSLTRMGRQLSGGSEIKHKVKKVDRLEGNKYLHQELGSIYQGLSSYVTMYLSQIKSMPLMIDLCFVKDDGDLQMLSAEIATKGRTLPLYREVFKKGELKGRAELFLTHVAKCLPAGQEVIVIMDAGFFEDWFKAIEQMKWMWICRVRQGRDLKFEGEEWVKIKDFVEKVGTSTKNYENVFLTKKHKHPCRIVTTTKKNINKKRKESPRSIKKRKIGSSCYVNSAKEPWILATNLPMTYTATDVITYYKKRMQIEESFRDVKSHQFGLSGRDIRTTSVERWGVKMLLAAIVQIVYWIIGIIGHHQGMQRRFQANTVKDKKVFSNFTLGQLIIEHNKLKELNMDYKNLLSIVRQELANA